MSDLEDTRLPMTVIGGYLGAGKTTLINRLLAEPHGKRLMVLVNDFGAINIDAELLDSASEDTLELTNGCVCCTMGNDLFMAISDVLKRRPRPDHLIVEASGIADPRKIANAAIAEPELRYGGIVVVVDAGNFPNLLGDPLISPQIRDQTASADLVVVSKAKAMTSDLADMLAPLIRSKPVLTADISVLNDLLLSPEHLNEIATAGHSHPDYERWTYTGQREFDRSELVDLLRRRPGGMFRAKGFARAKDGSGWTIQIVGQNLSLTPLQNCPQTVLVGIGLRAGLKQEDCQLWWDVTEPAHAGDPSRSASRQ